MSPHQQSLIYLHLSVLLFSATALFAKLIHLSALDITVYRTAVATVALFLLLYSRKKAIKLASVKDYCIAVMLGVIVGIHWLTYFIGIQMAGVTIGIIAFFSYPVITVFLEPMFRKSLPKLRDLFSAMVVVFGIYLLVPEAKLGNNVTYGVIISIVSACFFSFRNILQKRYFTGYSGPQTMMYQTLTACLMLSVFVEIPPQNVSVIDWQLIFLVGIVFTALPHSLFSASLRNLSATTASLISCLQPLYASLLAVIILAERPNLITIIGGLLVVSAAFFETWSVSKRG